MVILMCSSAYMAFYERSLLVESRLMSSFEGPFQKLDVIALNFLVEALDKADFFGYILENVFQENVFQTL